MQRWIGKSRGILFLGKKKDLQRPIAGPTLKETEDLCQTTPSFKPSNNPPNTTHTK
jgi:hypothetical protein